MVWYVIGTQVTYAVGMWKNNRKKCGLAHATGVCSLEEGTVFLQWHRVKSKKAQITHELGTGKTYFWHSLAQFGHSLGTAQAQFRHILWTIRTFLGQEAQCLKNTFKLFDTKLCYYYVGMIWDNLGMAFEHLGTTLGTNWAQFRHDLHVRTIR